MVHSLHATLLRPAAAWARQAVRPRVVLAAAAVRASSSSAPAAAAPAPAPAVAAAPVAEPVAPATGTDAAAEAEPKPKRGRPPGERARKNAANAAALEGSLEDIAGARAAFEKHPHWTFALHHFEQLREQRRKEHEDSGDTEPIDRVSPGEAQALRELGVPRVKQFRRVPMSIFRELQRGGYEPERIVEVLQYFDANNRSMPPDLYRHSMTGRISASATRVRRLPRQPPPPPPELGPVLHADPYDNFPEHMPPLDQWRHELEPKILGYLGKGRYFVRSRSLAERIVEEMDLDGKQGVTVVEAYAGVGSVTRLLLDHPAVDKVLAMEDNPSMLSFLERLKTDETLSRGLPGDRLYIEKGNAYRWTTYERMRRAGAFDHLQDPAAVQDGGFVMGPVSPRSHDAPDWQKPSSIIFLCHLPNSVHGEQLYAQLVAAVASRGWLFQYGRVKMVVLCSEALALRALAQPGTKHRHKLGVTTQTLTDVREAVEPSELTPLASHIYPCPLSKELLSAEKVDSLERDRAAESRQHRADYRLRKSLIVVEPKAQPLLVTREMEAFEHMVRNTFVLRSQPIRISMEHLAPGAINVLRKLHPDHPDMQDRQDEAINPDTPVWSLTIKQWVALSKAYDKWPFRPKMLLDEFSVFKERSMNRQK